MRKIPSRVLLALILASGVGAPVVSSAASSQDSAASQPANAARPEFVKPFDEAQKLIKDGKGTEAIAKLNEAGALPNLSPYEQFLLVRVRATAKYASGDTAGSIPDFEAAINSPQMTLEERLPLEKALANICDSTEIHQYDKAVFWADKYYADGGTDPNPHLDRAHALYLLKDYPNAAKAYQQVVDAEYASGHTPPESRLKVLRSAYGLSKDDAGADKVLEHLALSYPNSDGHYWDALVSRASKEKLNDRQYVDIYRLQTAINHGVVADEQRLSFAELAERAGFPSEAKRLLDDGFAKKSFTGSDLADAQKLLPQATRGAAADKAQAAANESAARSAKDGNAAAGLGLLDVIDGNPQQGVALLSLAMDKGGLKYPDEVRLHLGMAQYNAGQLPDALKTFQAASGPAGVGQIAHVWALFVQSKMQPAAAPAAAASK